MDKDITISLAEYKDIIVKNARQEQLIKDLRYENEELSERLFLLQEEIEGLKEVIIYGRAKNVCENDNRL